MQLVMPSFCEANSIKGYMIDRQTLDQLSYIPSLLVFFGVRIWGVESYSVAQAGSKLPT